MSVFENKNDIFRAKFKSAFKEIDYLDSDINKQKGWIFKNHIHSIEELLESRHHKKIYAITRKIGDDANYWELNGKLSEESRYNYTRYREDIDDKLHDINLKIRNREPTWWEEVKGTLSEFVVKIMNNLPTLKGWLLEAGKLLSRLPGPLGGAARLITLSTSTVYRIASK